MEAHPHQPTALETSGVPTGETHGRPPGHTLVCVRSLRGLHRLLVLSLLGQIVTIGLVVSAGSRGERQQGIGAPGIDLLPRGEGP